MVPTRSCLEAPLLKTPDQGTWAVQHRPASAGWYMDFYLLGEQWPSSEDQHPALQWDVNSLE